MNPIAGNLLRLPFYEFMCTKYQSLKKTDSGWNLPPGSGNESYFVHGVYKSGLSYHNRMFVTPFAIPVMIVDGTNYGSGNNRIVLHHIGINGYLTKQIQWRSLLSFSRNYGTYGNAYKRIDPNFFKSPRNQYSALGELQYHFPNNRWQAGISVAADKGGLLPGNVGAQLSLQYRIF